jgi:hypothetical protein
MQERRCRPSGVPASRPLASDEPGQVGPPPRAESAGRAAVAVGAVISRPGGDLPTPGPDRGAIVGRSTTGRETNEQRPRSQGPTSICMITTLCMITGLPVRPTSVNLVALTPLLARPSCAAAEGCAPARGNRIVRTSEYCRPLTSPGFRVQAFRSATGSRSVSGRSAGYRPLAAASKISAGGGNGYLVAMVVVPGVTSPAVAEPLASSPQVGTGISAAHTVAGIVLFTAQPGYTSPHGITGGIVVSTD